MCSYRVDGAVANYSTVSLQTIPLADNVSVELNETLSLDDNDSDLARPLTNIIIPNLDLLHRYSFFKAFDLSLFHSITCSRGPPPHF